MLLLITIQLSLKGRGITIYFNPSTVSFFYGWGILVAGAFEIFMSISGQTMGWAVVGSAIGLYHFLEFCISY
jgi:hypothetical protein